MKAKIKKLTKEADKVLAEIIEGMPDDMRKDAIIKSQVFAKCMSIAAKISAKPNYSPNTAR